MTYWKLIKKFLLPGGVVVAATPIAVSSKDSDTDKKAVRPSELPIYVDEIKRKAPEVISDEPGPFEEVVGSVRKELCTLVGEVNSISNKASAVVRENLDASNEILDFLREEENIAPRTGAIALSALTGLVFGLRGGFFKRLIYMSVGGGGMAALCYPKEAEEYFNEGIVEGRKIALIGHHLATSMLEDLRGASSDSSDDSSKEGKGSKSG